MTEPFVLSFADTSVAEGNRLAGSLAATLRDVDPSVSVERLRKRPDTQDFGATLAVILGTTAVTALAKGIAAWIARNSGAKLEIRRNGKLILSATNLESTDASRIAEAFAGKG